MALPAAIAECLRLPVIGAPMFLVSGPELVIEQCKAGIVGAFPALNARPQAELDVWLTRVGTALREHRQKYPRTKTAPFAVNLIVNAANPRLATDFEVCIRHKVPLIITSLSAPTAIVKRVHEYGGIVLHDAVKVRHAEKALEAGVDGVILVCAGAGGHAGALSPFALVNEVRRFFSGPLVLAGGITSGSGILAAQAMGCDAVYMGTRFIATSESLASAQYKQMILDTTANDIIYTPLFSGVHGSYLGPSIRAAGLDPHNLPRVENAEYRVHENREKKAWKDIWGAGQGVGNIDKILPVAQVVDGLEREYLSARARLAG